MPEPVLAAVGKAVAKAALVYAVQWAIGGILRALRRTRRIDPAREVTISSTRTRLPVIYGRARVGGTLAFAEPTGTTNEFFWVVYAFCHGTIEGIEEVYLDDNLAINAGGTIQSTPVDYTGVLAYGKYLGTDTQDTGTTGYQGGTLKGSDITAAFAAWDSAHRGRGVAYLILRLKHDTNIWLGGLPKVEVVVKGRTLYDPRTAGTAYSTNPTLAQRDYLASTRYGVRVASADLDDSASGLQAEANYADELVDVPAGTGGITITSSSVANPTVITATAHAFATGNSVWIRNHTGSTPAINGKYTVTVTGANTFTVPVNVTVGGTGGTAQKVTTQKRFEANGVLDANRPLVENLEGLLTASRAEAIFSAGTWRVYTRRARTAESFALTEDHIMGPWSWRTPSAADMPNSLHVSFVNAARAWKTESFDWPLPGMTNGYLSDDNNFPTSAQLELPYTQSRYTAEQIAMVARKEARQLWAELPASEQALKYALDDRVNLTHVTPGWSAKSFWVAGLGIRPDARVDLALMEYDATIYDYDMTDDVDGAVNTTLPNPWAVTAPTALVLVSGLPTPQIRATWTPSTDLFVTHYEIEAREASDSFRPRGTVTNDRNGLLIGPVGDAETWYVRVRAFNSHGVASAWIEASHTVVLVKVAAPTFNPAPYPAADASSVTYAVTFDAYTEYVEVYSRENVGTGGANPGESVEYLAGVLRKNVQTTLRIATTANYYRRTLMVAYTKDGIRGNTSGIVETQAVASGAGPTAAPTTLAAGAATPTTIPITWSNNGDTLSQTRVYLNNAIIFTTAINATAYTITGLVENTSYQVDVDHLRNGQASARAGNVAMSTTQSTLDAPTALSAGGGRCGSSNDPYMVFEWALGANAAGAKTVIEESVIGDFTDAATVLTSAEGATTATSDLHTTGAYTFRAKHTKTGWNDSAWSATDTGTYGACQPL